MNLQVTKEFSWAMAHMLTNHDGLCKNLHGHTYKMSVTVQRRFEDHVVVKTGSSQDMVVDFKDLKEIVENEIVSPLDHSFVYWTKGGALELEIANACMRHKAKVKAFEFRPTAELMAANFFEVLEAQFLEVGLVLICVKVWETPTAYAEVYP
jgi:6-pyruvoyltetrahydropterin/6-carboxytetrahydropterin synthase